ncbi:MAG: DUF4105 domain-containing protein [Candidatus Omnitrophica bacterium]|nr:DUF4105 domain-containing protein [Candidatus Omnitrophota bacterium]
MSTQAQASSLKEVLDKAERLNLASHPIWLKLLHYGRNGRQSVVLTDSFFLSPNGRSDPEAELIATINAYFTLWGENPNEHARCRFPARYYWLSHQLPLPNYNLRETHCQKLEKWALFDSVNSISVLLVSGYLGNPASTFGHAFLKFNTDSIDDQVGLFDLTLNYGAVVPENENTLLYVARGLFGGYKAGFSDKYFYTQDLVYSRTEFRDIWDYKLALTDYQRTLLILHIWEIAGNKFKYYFLDKNCVYRLAELLELVIEEDLLSNGRFWYLPVELFYHLKDVDKARRKSFGANLIQSVRFIPSTQRVLYHQLKLLTPDELKVFNAIIQAGGHSISSHLAKFTSDRQIIILDSLLAYQQYRLIAEEPNPSSERRKFKDQILLVRLQLPACSKPSLEIKELLSPADSTRPMEFGVSVASEDSGRPFLRLNWAPFKQEKVGKSSLEGNELVVFDLAVGFFGDEHKVFLDKLDLLRILNLNTLPVSVVDESQWSWQLRIGSNRIKDNEKYSYDGVVSFGLGRAKKWNEAITSCGMVDFAAHTISPLVRLRPHLGLKFDLREMQTWLYFGAESVNYDAEFREAWGGKLQYQLNDRYAVHVELSNENATRVSFGVSSYW